MWETSSLTARIGGSHVFIFQAEDGIRDLYVTGVQTCALPICRPRPPPEETPASSESSPPCARGASPRSGARCDRGTRACRRLDRWRAPTRSRRRSEEHTSELQSRRDLVCRLLLEKKNKTNDLS